MDCTPDGTVDEAAVRNKSVIYVKIIITKRPLMIPVSTCAAALVIHPYC